jgi:hypothetical protein
MFATKVIYESDTWLAIRWVGSELKVALVTELDTNAWWQIRERSLTHGWLEILWNTNSMSLIQVDELALRSATNWMEVLNQLERSTDRNIRVKEFERLLRKWLPKNSEEWDEAEIERLSKADLSYM